MARASSITTDGADHVRSTQRRWSSEGPKGRSDPDSVDGRDERLFRSIAGLHRLGSSHRRDAAEERPDRKADMNRRALVVAIATLATVAATVSTANAAVRPFGPEVTAAGACGQGLGETVTGPDGTLRGFAECGIGNVRLRFFSRTAAGVVNPSQDSGFVGTVLGVTADATATYVLFRTETTILIGKRTNAGVFSSRAVDTWSGAVPPRGDVIARDGRWFAVWNKQVGPGGEFADVELFQGGSVEPFRRITTRPDVDDADPTLAYSGTIPVLVWSREQAPAVPGPADLWVAKYLNGGWQSRVFASLGTLNLSPDIATAGGLTYVTWQRDGAIVVAGNSTGAFASHTFLTRGFAPKVAASATAGPVDHVFATWTSTDSRVFFAETASRDAVTGWEGIFLTSGAVSGPYGLSSQGGKATVAYSTDTVVRLRSQL
jgi:hypothetical protein